MQSVKIRISLATKLALTFSFVVLASMLAVTWAVRKTTIARFTHQYENEIATSLQSIQAELRGRQAAIKHQLRQLGEQLRTDQKFRLHVLVRKNYQHREVIDYAQIYMPTMGLSVLEISNSEGVVLSSGHDRTSFGKRTAELIQHLQASREVPNLVAFQKGTREMLCLADLESVEIAGQTFFILGGVVIDPTFLSDLKGNAKEILHLGWLDTQITTSSALDPKTLQSTLEGPAADGESFSIGRIDLALYKNGSTTHAALRLLYPKTELAALLASLSRRIFVIAGLGLFFAIIAAVWLSRSVARPLTKLAGTAANLSLEKLDAQFDLDGSDEVGVLNDAMWEMQLGLRRSRLKLADAEKRAAFAQIARQVNHDIKNGFIPIRNVMRHWQDVAERQPEQLAHIFNERKSSVLESVDYLENLARSYARLKPALNPTRVSVNSILESLVKNYDRAAKSQVKFRTNYDQSQPSVHADQVQLYRAFENVLHNALDAVGEQGEISIRTKLEQTAVVIEFQDNGCGIPDEIREQLFKPHVTSKATGSGLGLVNVKSIIEDSGGRVKITSDVGVGTTVEISLQQN